MGLIVCFACGRQREIKPIKKGTTYFCSNCGAKKVRLIRSRNHANMVSWTEKDGVDAEQAWHRLYSGLRRIAEHKGYKKGWIAHKFREIIGRWPNGEAVESAAPADASLRWWIQQQGRIYARERKAKEAKESFHLDNGSVWGNNGVQSLDDMAISPLMTEEDWGVKL